MRSPTRIAVAALCALAALTSPATGLLWLLPLLALVALLAIGCYPGEETLLAHRRSAPALRVRPAAVIGDCGRAPYAIGPSGSALLAFNRAVRPPPRVVSA